MLKFRINVNVYVFKELRRNNMHESTETLHIVKTPWTSMHILVYTHMSVAGTRVSLRCFSTHTANNKTTNKTKTPPLYRGDAYTQEFGPTLNIPQLAFILKII